MVTGGNARRAFRFRSRADETRVVATGTVPIGTLPPGDYVVRGVIRLEDGTTGRVMRTLRKVAR